MVFLQQVQIAVKPECGNAGRQGENRTVLFPYLGQGHVGVLAEFGHARKINKFPPPCKRQKRIPVDHEDVIPVSRLYSLY